MRGGDWGNFCPLRTLPEASPAQSTLDLGAQSRGTVLGRQGSWPGLSQQLSGPWRPLPPATRLPLVASKSCLEDEREICPLLRRKVSRSRRQSVSSTQSPGENL